MADVGNSKTHLASPSPPPGDMPAFYIEISSVQDTLRRFNDNVAQISDLHSRSLNNMDDAAAQRNAAQLDELVEDTSALSATLKKTDSSFGSTKGLRARRADKTTTNCSCEVEVRGSYSELPVCRTTIPHEI